MKIIYGKTLNQAEESAVNKIALECGVLYDTARLLYYRKIDTVDKAKKYLHPSKSQFYAPYLFNNMKNIVERIKIAKENQETVLICGDYDVDGVCATTILYKTLKEYGINTLCTIPEREDGYGINLEEIENICSNEIVDLIITVDCGISEKEKISQLLDVGIDVIVTDHHEPPENLPDCLIINPKVKNSGYPFDGLCGAGVAYKLSYALTGEKANKYLDFVALATVADSMDLVDENRALVYEGLKLYNSNNIRTAFKCLIGETNKQITSQVLAYNIGPKINAGGRMGDAKTSLQLLINENPNEVVDLAIKLSEYNIIRQVKCDEIYKSAIQVINDKKLYEKNAILVADENWHSGVVGIVAAKIVEKYKKPVIVFAEQNGYFKGSARSVDGVNLYNAISNSSKYLRSFGGHSQAVGVSVEKENFNVFYDELCANLNEEKSLEDVEKTICVEWEINHKFSLDFAREIDMLEPFGIGNKKPLFSINVNKVNCVPIKKDSPHYTIKLNEIEILNFNGEKHVFSLGLPVNKTLVFEPNFSIFRDEAQVKGYLKNIVLKNDNLQALENHFFRNELLKIKDNYIDNNNKTNNYSETDNTQILSGKGTLYIASNSKVLEDKNIPSNVKTYLFNLDEFSTKNAIIISPSEISDGYKNIVYLDKPLSCLPNEARVVSSKKVVETYITLLTDRTIFSNIYSYLKSIQGKLFISSVDYCTNNQVPFDSRQFIFSCEVFMELGIFYVQDGILKENKNLKSALTNSKIYNRICNISEELWTIS